ncbi:hypothetical protein C0Q70_06246 [Pomacea canaliculata]|uniref:Major facilitator superfamily (MFS) profile domain-containing protein n=1 Tax=Pomacea canaliculata TaxID=400727 RepID=A0A2T7PNG3_POMCA|nr:hypothetical protein C0Q70_06246 [Pomacea canaliculata]
MFSHLFADVRHSMQRSLATRALQTTWPFTCTIVLFFVVFFVFTIFETIATPLGMDMYGWSKPQASLYMGIVLAGAGILAIVVFLVVKLLAKRFDSRLLLIAGYVFCFVGFFIFLPWGHKLPVMGYADIVTPFRPNITHTTMALSPRDLTHFLPSRVANGNEIAAPLTSDLRYTQDFRSDPTSLLDVTTSTTTNVTAAPEGCPWSFAWCGQVPQVRLQQFLGGTVAIAIGYPVCNVMTYTLFSKVLGPQPQGLWMGYLTATGSLARTLGPIFVSQIYDAYGPRVTFASACAVLLLTVGLCLLSYRRLLPFSDTPYRRRPDDEYT